MKSRPILFSAPMVQALMEGRKTQTRRIIKPQPTIENNTFQWIDLRGNNSFACFYGGISEVKQIPSGMNRRCPYGEAGDLLWVRESCSKVKVTDQAEWKVYYRADNEVDGIKWRPSIHMPRWASRLTLEIIGVRVERLQDISAVDAAAEGCQEEDGEDVSWSIYNFHTLWASINGEDSWTANPWVWVLDFKVHKMNVDEFLKMVK